MARRERPAGNDPAIGQGGTLRIKEGGTRRLDGKGGTIRTDGKDGVMRTDWHGGTLRTDGRGGTIRTDGRSGTLRTDGRGGTIRTDGHGGTMRAGGYGGTLRVGGHGATLRAGGHGGTLRADGRGGAQRSDVVEIAKGPAKRALARSFVWSDVVPWSRLPGSFVPPSSDRPLTLAPELLARIHECFGNLAGPASVLDAAALQRSLNVDSDFLAERMLAVFDRDRDGLVSRVEFVQGVPRLLFGTERDKLRFVFRLHDINGDGYIDHEELDRMLELALTEDGVMARQEVSQRLSDLLFEAADTNRDGRLSFSEFEALANNHPQATALIFRSESSWIAPKGELSEDRSRRAGFARRLLRFLDNRSALVIVVLLWVLANAALFTHAVLKYDALGKNELVQIARGCGACINLNGALIVLTMARRTLTFARRAPLLRLLPLDDSVAIHGWLGSWLLIFSLVHTAAHGANWAMSEPGLWASLAESSAGWSGVALLGVFGVIWLFSRPRIRGSRHFELFYWTHLLYLVWFALALLHGPVFWMWAGIPLAIFAVDRLLRLFRSVSKTEVFACEPLASGVTRLTIEKPDEFRHRAGDYVYLKLPALARYEWHPFTISSAPERPELTLHVRSLGNFTSALHELARNRSHLESPPILRAHLDGPFGTASHRIFESRRAVLIGAGIGVTPFASVLESIVLRGQAGEGELEKVFFYWLNRDAVSFEWFAKLLASLEREAPEGLVDIRIFMTGGRGGNISSTLLNLAREVAHELGDPDVITGLASMTTMGPPDWRTELFAIARDYPDAEVFFCGPSGLARTIRGVCSELGLGFQQEHF